MLCEDEVGTQFQIVVKLRAGIGSGASGTTGSICELLSSMLANDLGIRVPKPFIVDVDSNFHRAIPDPTLAEIFRKSQGVNFGSQYLNEGYTTWPQERDIPPRVVQMAADIFAFDLMIQNPDRRPDKPNLLRKGDDLVIYDHELAFSFLYMIGQTQYPWDNAGVGFLRDHLFFGKLKGRDDLSWTRLQDALEVLDDRRLMRYAETVPVGWRQESLYPTEQIVGYIAQVRDQSKRLFQKVREVLV